MPPRTSCRAKDCERWEVLLPLGGYMLCPEHYNDALVKEVWMKDGQGLKVVSAMCKRAG
jgi:hypothetical protein